MWKEDETAFNCQAARVSPSSRTARYPEIEVFAKDGGHKPFRLHGRPLRLCNGSEPKSGGGGGSGAGNLPSRSQGEDKPSRQQQRERPAFHEPARYLAQPVPPSTGGTQDP